MADLQGEYVGSGSFRVDRARALETLSRFRLADPRMYVLPLVRCAVRGGATAISFKTAGWLDGEVTMDFDGRPFVYEELRDPFACLFGARTAQTGRLRDLAQGLLTALALDPETITVRSGDAAGGTLLTLRGLGKESAERLSTPLSGTTIRLKSGAIVRRLPREFEFIRSHCRASAVPITVGGEAAPRFPEEEAVGDRDSGARRLWVREPSQAHEESVVALYSWGVLARSVEIRLPRVQIEAELDDDAFALDISLTGVIRNARYREALEFLAVEAERLLRRRLGDMRRRLPVTARRLTSPKLYYFWKETMARWSREAEPGGLWTAFSAIGNFVDTLSDGTLAVEYDQVEEVRSDARTVAWLRDACRRLLKDREKDSRDPVLKELWETPLYLTSSGRAVSILELEESRRRQGVLPLRARTTTNRLLPFDTLACRTFADLLEIVAGDYADEVGVE